MHGEHRAAAYRGRQTRIAAASEPYAAGTGGPKYSNNRVFRVEANRMGFCDEHHHHTNFTVYKINQTLRYIQISAIIDKVTLHDGINDSH